jgi:hypothetical protein
MADKKKPVIVYYIAGSILILVEGKQPSVAQFVKNEPGMAAPAKVASTTSARRETGSNPECFPPALPVCDRHLSFILPFYCFLFSLNRWAKVDLSIR